VARSPDLRPPAAMREVNSWGRREVSEVVQRGLLCAVISEEKSRPCISEGVNSFIF
jgi:hypothetical protein